MADNDTSANKPWAAIAAAAAFAALAGFHYFTLTAIEAQSDANQQMIDASSQSASMENRGLRTRQQLILAEVRELRVEAGAGHGDVAAPVDEGAGAEASEAEGEGDAEVEADVEAEDSE